MISRLSLTLAVTGALVVSACTPVDAPTTSDNQRTREGALTGALIGGVLGAAAQGNDDVKGALIGATVGALAGGAVGASLDQQARELRAELDGRVQIINTGNELIVRMPQDILFATDSASLQPTLVADLNDLARNLLRYPDTVVQVVGHTDDTGSDAYNIDLSQRRANAVASVLISGGVPAGRIAAIGRGESQPVASNGTAAGRALNRRVDVVIRPTR